MKLIPSYIKKQTTKFTEAYPFIYQKADDKIYICKIPKKCVTQPLSYNSMTRGKTVDLDEGAHHELCHQDLHYLQGQLFLYLALKVLNRQKS